MAKRKLIAALILLFVVVVSGGCTSYSRMSEDTLRVCDAYTRTTATDAAGLTTVTETYAGQYKEQTARGIKRKTKYSDTELKKLDVKCGELSLAVNQYDQKMNSEAITAKGQAVQGTIKAGADAMQEAAEAYAAVQTGGLSTVLTSEAAA